MMDKLEMEAQLLFTTWVRHFRQQDLTLPYTQVETAHTLFLPESNVLLVGIVDAEGDNFFSEYKTANPRGAKTWKREWLLSTQALTYGLLTGGEKPYLVRKVFKGREPFCDHEWFKFSPDDLNMWRRQIKLMADDISYNERNINSPIPWPMNIEHGCFAYGPNYPCSFFHEGCSKHNFSGPITGSSGAAEFFPEFGDANSKNRAILNHAIAEHPNALVLSSTRMKNWQRCRELYRRSLLQGFPASEAMLLGSRFHALVGEYTTRLMESRRAK